MSSPVDKRDTCECVANELERRRQQPDKMVIDFLNNTGDDDVRKLVAGELDSVCVRSPARISPTGSLGYKKGSRFSLGLVAGGARWEGNKLAAARSRPCCSHWFARIVSPEAT